MSREDAESFTNGGRNQMAEAFENVYLKLKKKKSELPTKGFTKSEGWVKLEIN